MPDWSKIFMRPTKPTQPAPTHEETVAAAETLARALAWQEWAAWAERPGRQLEDEIVAPNSPETIEEDEEDMYNEYSEQMHDFLLQRHYGPDEICEMAINMLGLFPDQTN